MKQKVNWSMKIFIAIFGVAYFNLLVCLAFVAVVSVSMEYLQWSVWIVLVLIFLFIIRCLIPKDIDDREKLFRTIFTFSLALLALMAALSVLIARYMTGWQKFAYMSSELLLAVVMTVSLFLSKENLIGSYQER